MKKYILAFLLAACVCAPFIQAQEDQKKTKAEKKERKQREKAAKKARKARGKMVADRIDTLLNGMEQHIEEMLSSQSRSIANQIVAGMTRLPITVTLRPGLTNTQKEQLGDISTQIETLGKEVTELAKQKSHKKITLIHAALARRHFRKAVKRAARQIVGDKVINEKLEKIQELQERAYMIAGENPDEIAQHLLNEMRQELPADVMQHTIGAAEAARTLRSIQQSVEE